MTHLGLFEKGFLDASAGEREEILHPLAEALVRKFAANFVPLDAATQHFRSCVVMTTIEMARDQLEFRIGETVELDTVIRLMFLALDIGAYTSAHMPDLSQVPGAEVRL